MSKRSRFTKKEPADKQSLDDDFSPSYYVHSMGLYVFPWECGLESN